MKTSNRKKAIFLQALEKKTAQERSEFLDEACRGDSALRQGVEELLRSAEQTSGFLDGAAIEAVSNIDEIDIDRTPSISIRERPGTIVGPYKLMELIGEGGFGLVFVAEQHEPVRRRVALKLIKPGMDSRDVINRFEAERQALALMDHPNIARVFDAGTTESGRPFFVMELVRGVPITKYCDQSQLSLNERLELFVSVCRAIQHAHQKGIIHRDVKPSNVLVTLHDGVPVVKVIDFGVAKALNQQLTNRTVYTRFAQLIGTPLYMSPEQAEMSGLDVDTRSDIYSLGVLLYELLTGATPFDRKRFSEAAFDEFRRIIREEEPPKPSTRLSQSGDRLPSLAAQRKLEPTKLSKVMRGELDWIVMKALEKDRNRRYDTAKGFAADVQRYLRDEAVIACPPTAGYRVRKFARRNKTLLATFATVAAALIVGTVLSTWQAVRASQAEKRAKFAAAEASDNANRAEASEENLRESESALRERVYAADMNVVSAAYADGAIDRMNDVLEKHLASSSAEDQRGLEWYYWWRAGHLARGKVRHTLTRPFGHMAVSPDGKTIALSGWPRHLYLYDSENLCLLRAPLQIGGQSFRPCFTPDGRFLVAASEHQSVGTRVLDTKSWETVASLPVDYSVVAFATAQPLMVLGNQFEGEFQLWTWIDASWELLGQWKSFGKVEGVEITPDGKFLVAHMSSVEGNQRIEVWDVDDRAKIRILDFDDTKGIRAVSLSSDGNYLAVGEQNGDIRIWNSDVFTKGGQPKPFKTLSLSAPVNSVAFSQDGTRLIAGTSATNNVVVWGMESNPNDLPVSIHAHSRRVCDVQFGEDPNIVYSAGEDGYLKIWDLSRCEPFDTIRGVDSMSQIEYADDNTLVFLDCRGMIQRWDISARELKAPLDKESKYQRIALSDDGGYLAGVTYNNELCVWNLASRKIVHTRPFAAERDYRLIVSRNGRRVACTVKAEFEYGYVSLVDFDNQSRSHGASLAERVIFNSRQAFAPDGQRLVVQRGGFTRQVSDLLDIAADPMQQLYQLDGWGSEVCAAFSHDGSTLAIGSDSYDIRLHNAASGKLLHTLRGHTGVPQCLAFNHDGSRLVSAGDDGTVRIWKIGARECRLLSTLRGNSGKIEAISVSPEDSSIASVSDNGTLLVWRTASPSEVGQGIDQQLAKTRSIARSDLQVLAQRARLSHARGDWKTAIADYTAALELAPDNEFFLQSRAEALAQAGQWNDSLNDWTRLIQLTGSHNLEYFCRRGECYLSQGRRVEASADFTKALTLTSGLPWQTKAVLQPIDSVIGLGESIVPIGTAWNYSTNRPSENWYSSPEETSWIGGAAPFGTGVLARTNWSSSPDIWLRKTFELDQEIDAPLVVCALADDDADVYLNGVLAAHVSSSEQYKTVECSKEARLRRGKNIIAVHGHDAGWDASAVDVGLYVRGDPATFGKVLAAAVEQAPEIQIACREYLVENERWNEAAAVCETLSDASPDDAIAAAEGLRAAVSYMCAGELDEYQRVCSKLVERFGTTTIPEVAERVAKACLVALPNEATVNVANQLVDLSMQDPNYWNGDLIPWSQSTKALAEYRSGSEQSAIEWGEKSLDTSASVPSRKALCFGVLAMAHAQLRDHDAAREIQNELKEILREHSPFQTAAELDGNWHDWLLCDLFLREAEALLKAAKE